MGSFKLFLRVINQQGTRKHRVAGRTLTLGLGCKSQAEEDDSLFAVSIGIDSKEKSNFLLTLNARLPAQEIIFKCRQQIRSSDFICSL